MTLPADYRWLEKEPGPKMILEALKLFGTVELPGNADSPVILGWAKEVGLERVYSHDAIPWCFHQSTLVTTPSGHRPISAIAIGDAVIGMDGSPHAVGRALSRVRETIELKALGVAETLTTDDHPYLVRRRTETTYVKGKRVREVAAAAWVPAGQLRRGDFIALPPVPAEGAGGPSDAVAFLLGLYVAEGTGRADPRRRCIHLNIAHSETDDVLRFCQRAGIERKTVSNRRTCTQIEIRDRWFVELCAPFGRIAIEKIIPSDALKWRTEARQALLDGYVFGDGHLVERLNRTDCSTISLALAISVCELARSLGLRPQLRVDRRAGTHVIEGRCVNMRDRFIINWHKWSPAGSYPRGQSFTDGGFTWTPVRSVVSRSPRETVHDLTVEGSSFIANGAVVHNCGLYMAVVAKRAGKDVPANPLWALNWQNFGMPMPHAGALLGDVLTFVRNGGGHVALYVGEDGEAFHVLGGNQRDQVCFTRIDKARLHSVSRPHYNNQPANVRKIVLKANGALSGNEQ